MIQAGWTVLHARKKNAPHPLQAFPPPPDQNLNNPYAQNQMMYPAGPDPDAPPLAPVQEGPLPNVDPNAMPYMGEKQSMDQYAQSSTFPPVQPEDVCDGQTYPSVRKDRSHNKRRRASTGTRYNDDVDSYYSRSPTRGRRHSYSGQGSQDYIMPPPAQPVDDVPATSPISLYGPEEYRRRLEQQRRSRRKSLVQPSSMQFDPQTGRYVEPAERFVQRSSQGLPSLEEEEDEEAIRADRLRPDDPRLRQDGFANRTMVWKRLQRNTGIL